jgi:hypothetical protein
MACSAASSSLAETPCGVKKALINTELSRTALGTLVSKGFDLIKNHLLLLLRAGSRFRAHVAH